MQRLTLVCVLAVLMLVVAACGDDSKSDGGTAGSNGPVTLTIWYWGVPDAKVMDAIDKQYMAEHPDVTIKRVVQPVDAYLGTLMRSAIAKRSGPDLMATFASPFAFDFKQGTRPLDDLITDQQREDIIGFDQTVDNGETLVVPLDAGGQVFYYDKAKFSKAGLDPEAPPTTWDELLNACDKLKAAGIVPINGAFKDGGYLELLMMAFQAQYQTEEENAKKLSDPDWASPSIGKTIDLIKDLQDRGCFTPDSNGINLFPDGVNNFKAGKAAISLGFAASDFHWAQLRETKWGKDGLGVFLPPLVPDSLWDAPRLTYGANSGYSITKWSEHAKEAYDYLMYLDTPAVQEKLFAEDGSMPANRTAKPTSEDPVAQQLLTWVAGGDTALTQFNVIRANVESLFIKYAPQIMAGKKSYDDVASEMQAEQEKAAGSS
jgi:multiple sugar transport system substrate-binding protein